MDMQHMSDAHTATDFKCAKQVNASLNCPMVHGG